MPRPGQKIIEGLLKPIFKARHFLKSGQTWRRETPEFIHVFNLQSSQWSDSYMFNCGIAAKTTTTPSKLRAEECDVHYRMDSYQRDEADNIDFLDMTNAMDLQVRTQRIVANSLKGIAWMEKMSSRQAIIDLVARQKKNRSSDPGVSMRRGGFAYIGQALPPINSPAASSIVNLISPDGASIKIDLTDRAAVKASIKQILAPPRVVNDMESLKDVISGMAPKRNSSLPQLYFIKPTPNLPDNSPIGLLDDGRLVVTQPAQTRLEHSGLTGLTFFPSNGTTWEVLLHCDGALVSRRDSSTEVTLDIIQDTWSGIDFFIAHSTRRPCVSKRAQEFLLEHFPNCLEFSLTWKVSKQRRN